jgi:hypothetical protein
MKSPLTNFILACVVCLVAVAGDIFWNGMIGRSSARSAELETEISTKTALAARIASARASLTEIAGGEAKVRSYFVPETGVVAFISDLEAKGRAQGASVKVVDLSPTGSAARPSFTLKLAISGSFDAVLRTVGTIEYAPYDVSISALTLGAADKNTWSANATLVVGSVPATSPALPGGATTSTPKTP